MPDAIAAFIERLEKDDSLAFEETLHVIDTHYSHTPTAFSNGIGHDAINNAVDQNQGSCKLFAFAILHHLNEQQTLAAFGQHYRHVLEDPEGNDHANIRNFIHFGWDGIHIDGNPFLEKIIMTSE
jgi:hypothetical protein